MTALAVLPLAVLVLSISGWPLWFNHTMFATLPYYDTQQKALKIIPPNKSVLAPLTLLAHLSNREQDYERAQFDPQYRNLDTQPLDRMYQLDFVILDANERRFAQDVVNREVAMSFYTNAAYRVILNENRVMVFERYQ